MRGERERPLGSLLLAERLKEGVLSATKANGTAALQGTREAGDAPPTVAELEGRRVMRRPTTPEACGGVRQRNRPPCTASAGTSIVPNSTPQRWGDEEADEGEMGEDGEGEEGLRGRA